jgi:tetratricopeptide (TPR) repeat protein
MRLFVFLLAASLAGSAWAADSKSEFDALFDAKKWESAVAHAEQRLASDARDFGAAGDFARVLLATRQRDRYEEAIAKLEHALEGRADGARGWFLLGQLYGERARAAGLGGLSPAKKSKAALSRAVELEPRDFEYVYALNEYLLEAPFVAGGSKARARKVAREFAEVDADAGAMLAARVHLVEREYDEALALLEPLPRRELVLHDATRRYLLCAAGIGMLETGRAPRALTVFERVAAEFPNNAVAHYGLGRARLDTGDAAGAVGALTRSLEIERRLDTLYHLALAQEAVGRVAEAKELLSEAAHAARGAMADDIKRRLAALGE